MKSLENIAGLQEMSLQEINEVKADGQEDKHLLQSMLSMELEVVLAL